MPLIIFGTAKVKKVRISAVLSGLKLEAEIRNVHASATHKERIKGIYTTRLYLLPGEAENGVGMNRSVGEGKKCEAL